MKAETAILIADKITLRQKYYNIFYHDIMVSTSRHKNYPPVWT